MRLENTFQVPLPVDDAWNLLTDLPRIARCLPGAHLDETIDGEHRGGLTAKIGPITARYRGSASFLERDDVDHRAVISARGREEHGSGTATATITAALVPDMDGTRVNVSTDLAITGRAAQFGRSLLAEVSTTLVTEFVTRLETLIKKVPAEDPATATSPAMTPSATADAANSLNVVPTLVVPLLRRAAVPATVALTAATLGWLLGRHHAARSRAGRAWGFIGLEAARTDRAACPASRSG